MRSISFPLTCFVLILSGLARERTAVAQELSPTILQIIPGVVEKLHSPNINDRISVLDELVKEKQTVHLPQPVFPYNLPASDYSLVVKSILDGNWEQLERNPAVRGGS